MVIPPILLRNKVRIGIGILVLLFALTAFYYYHQYQQAQYKLNNPAVVAKQEAKDTIADVGKLMLLPADEEPTVMQVTDVTKLKDQSFFARAQNGDKVLIYTNAKKAILYRVGTNKIIDITTINIAPTATPSGQTSPGPSTAVATPTPSEAPKIIIQ